MAKLTLDEHFKLLRSELKEIHADNLLFRAKASKIEAKILEVAVEQEDLRKEVSTGFKDSAIKFDQLRELIIQKHNEIIHGVADIIERLEDILDLPKIKSRISQLEKTIHA